MHKAFLVIASFTSKNRPNSWLVFRKDLKTFYFIIFDYIRRHFENISNLASCAKYVSEAVAAPMNAKTGKKRGKGCSQVNLDMFSKVQEIAR